MTARSTRPESIALMAKRQDTSAKPISLRKRGVNKDGGAGARSRGTDTSNLSAAEMAEVISPDKPLTEKQKLFVKFWAQGDSITSASYRAGYSDGGTIAYRLVKMPNILKLYNEEKALYEEAAQITRKSVMDMHMEAFEMAKLMSEPSTMVAAARELGKMAGYYAPVESRVKIDVTGNIVLDRMNQMTDAELLAVISKGAAQALTYVQEADSSGD